MGILNNIAVDNDVKDDGDSLGGGFLVDSGVYPCEIEMAYVTVTDKESVAVNLHLKTDTGAVVRSQLWVQSGKAKGNKNYYTDKNGEKHYLPGFNQAEAVCLLTIGKHLSEVDTEEKVIKLYSFEAKAEVPTNVDVMSDLIGEQITVGIIKQTVDKNTKDANGNYVPSGETRDENEIDKFFRSKDDLTVAEVRASVDKAEFRDSWEKKWKGKVRDKAKGAKAGSTPGAPPAADKPQKSLFT